MRESNLTPLSEVLSGLRKRVEEEYELSRARLEAERASRIRTLRAELDAERQKILADLDKKISQIEGQTEKDLQQLRLSSENQRTTLRRQIRDFYAKFDIAAKPWTDIREEELVAKGVGPYIRLGKFENDLGLDLPAILEFGSHIEFQTPKGSEAADILCLALLRSRIAVEGELSILPIDMKHYGGSFQSLDVQKHGVFQEIVTNEEQLSSKLKDVLLHVEEVNSHYLTRDKPDIATYNRLVEGQKILYRILAIANFPNGFDKSTLQTLSKIMRKGPLAGVYVYLHSENDLETLEDLDWTKHTRDLPLLKLTQTSKGRYAWRGGYLPQLEIIPDEFPKSLVVDQILGEDSEGLEQQTTNQALPFEEIMVDREKWGSEPSLESISVVVGRTESNQNFEIVLGNESKKIYHGVIFGGIGSGKGTLTRVFLTQLIAKYSPDELHLYLVDFKQGMDYAAYEGSPVPHLKRVVTSNTPEFALAVLQHLNSKLTERREDIDSLGGSANSMSFYRELSGKKMPRILLVIEELGALFEGEEAAKRPEVIRKIANLIKNLAKQGRAYGISVLLSSQDEVQGEMEIHTARHLKAVYKETNLRILLPLEFPDDIRRVMKLDDQDMVRAKDLEKGFALVNSSGDKVKIRVALLEQPDQVQLLTELRKFYTARGYEINAKFYNINKRIALSSSKKWKRHFSESNSGSSYKVWLGEALDKLDELTVEFNDSYGSNLVVTGGSEQEADIVLAPIFTSIAAANFGHKKQIAIGAVMPSGKRQGFFMDRRTNFSQNIQKTLKDLRSNIEGNAICQKNLLLLYDLRQFESSLLAEELGRYGLTEAGKDLLYVLRKGPHRGVNVLLWSPTNDAYDKLIRAFAVKDVFEHRVWLPEASNEGRYSSQTPSSYLASVELSGFGSYSSRSIPVQNAILFWPYESTGSLEELKRNRGNYE